MSWDRDRELADMGAWPGLPNTNNNPELSPMLEDPADGLTDVEPDGEPGPWVIADFDSPCSRGCQGITAGEEIRADGTGEWECRCCVDEDMLAQDMNVASRTRPDWV